ncbi:hypothetical protein M0R72_10465 [Candidatus Pacearchaeota archaeon]|jgi:DNA-directed RNA polymerase subunit RPC12/RpoP|nr:hypothetical protein [Candidatus Pacearchaeota archaeon]
MKLSCPECGKVFALDPNFKNRDTIHCPHCNFSAVYSLPANKGTEVDPDNMTPYQESMLDLLQEQEELLEEERRLQQGGYDYAGKNAWRAMMRQVGRLQS